MIIDEADIPKGRACMGLEVSRSGYYKKSGPLPDDSRLKDAIEKIALKFPYYGYRRITKQLRR